MMTRKNCFTLVVVIVMVISIVDAEAARKNITVKTDIPHGWKIQEVEGPDLEFICTPPAGETVWIYARIDEETSLRDFALKMSHQLKGSTPEGNDSVGYGFTFKHQQNEAFAEVYREDVERMPEISRNVCVAYSGESEELLDFINSIDLVSLK